MSIFQPEPCPMDGEGGSSPTPRLDAEVLVLCDVDNDVVVGYALAVYKFNNVTGTHVGPIALLDPTTGAPYVVQGALQICPTASGGGGVAETVSLSANTLAALENITAVINGTVSVDNFPALQTDGLTDAELRAAAIKVVLTSNGGVDAFIKTTPASDTDPGLVVRTAGTVDVQQVIDGMPLSNTNKLPVDAHLLDGDGAEYSDLNRLPVDIGTLTVEATFSSVVSLGNSYVGTLGPGQAFIGPWEDVSDYATISTLLVVTGVCQISRQFSIDGVTMDYEESAFAAAGFTTPLSSPAHSQFFRFIIENFAEPNDIRLETAFHFNAPSSPLTPVAAPVNDLSLTTNVSSLLHGRIPPDPLAPPGDPDALGRYVPIESDPVGVLSVRVKQPADDPISVADKHGDNGMAEGTLTAAAPALAAQTYWPMEPATAVILEVPDGHSSSAVEIRGVFSPGSSVVFEQSDSGLDGTWAATNMRRNNTPDVNESFSQIDNNPFGTNNVQLWKGTVGGIKFFRVRCAVLAPGDAPIVRLETSSGVGGTYLLGNPPSVSDYFTDGVLDSPGDVLVVRAGGMGSWASFMLGQFTGTVFFEASIDGINYTLINGAVQGVGTLQQSKVGTGQVNQTLQVRGSAGALRFIRLRAGNDFIGLLQGTLRTGAGTAGVFMSAPVPIAGLSAGAQTRRFSVGTSASQIDVAPLAVRTSVEILYQATGAANNGAVYVGFTNAVSAANGRQLQPGESWTLDLTSATSIFAIASAAGQQVQVTEIG